MEQIAKDAKLGRMTNPQKITELDHRSILLMPSFSVEQGLREDGSLRLRSIGDATRSGTNGTCRPREKLHNDGLDSLVATIRRLCDRGAHAVSLWKADIDAAYRRIPVREDQRWML